MSVTKNPGSASEAVLSPKMTTRTYDAIKVKGKETRVPFAEIAGRKVIVTGEWIKIAKVKDEELVEGEPIPNPQLFLQKLKQTGLNADILTFSQRLPNTTP